MPASHTRMRYASDSETLDQRALPHTPTGCVGGIHRFLLYTLCPTFQPGNCKATTSISLDVHIQCVSCRNQA